MKRSDIRGFTVKIGPWWIEYWSIYHIPAGIACYINGNRELKWRVER